jgi:hypothetical protein
VTLRATPGSRLAWMRRLIRGTRPDSCRLPAGWIAGPISWSTFRFLPHAPQASGPPRQVATVSSERSRDELRPPRRGGRSRPGVCQRRAAGITRERRRKDWRSRPRGPASGSARSPTVTSSPPAATTTPPARRNPMLTSRSSSRSPGPDVVPAGSPPSHRQVQRAGNGNLNTAGRCAIRLDGALDARDAGPLIHSAFNPAERLAFRLLGIRRFMRLRLAGTPAARSTGAVAARPHGAR